MEISTIVLKLLRCYDVKYQALFVPWCLAVQSAVMERHPMVDNEWPLAATLGHQLVAAVLTGVSAELPCEQLARYVRSVALKRRRRALDAGLMLVRRGAPVLLMLRDPSDASAGAGAGAGGGLESGLPSPGRGRMRRGSCDMTSARPDLTYWKFLGGSTASVATPLGGGSHAVRGLGSTARLLGIGGGHGSHPWDAFVCCCLGTSWAARCVAG